MVGSASRALLAVVMSLVLAVGVASADDVYVDVVVNGRFIEDGALVYGDRSYVKLSDVADVIGARYIYDMELKVAFLLTGRFQNLVSDSLLRNNPGIEMYNPISPVVPGMGIHYGVPGPHVTIGMTPTGIATVFEVVFPAGTVDHRPWFDQHHGHTESIPGVGHAYSQHLYVVDAALIQVGGETEVAFNGRRLDLAADALIWQGSDLYVRLRDLAEASGGGVGWDVANRTASAKIVPGPDLSLDWLKEINHHGMAHYNDLVPLAEGDGYQLSPPGPGVIITLDGADMITGVGTVFPEGSGPWFPWYDQPEGDEQEFAGYGRGYSQHIHLVERDGM